MLTIAKKKKQHYKNIQEKYHLSTGRITYSDLNNLGRPLYSQKYQLAGKPDYIIKEKEHHIPVEYKSSYTNHPKPYHIMQLAAYCQLLEDHFNIFVPYGILIYENNRFTIPNTPKLRFELAKTIKKMRDSIKKQTIHRTHNNVSQCRHCSMKNYCTEKLI